MPRDPEGRLDGHYDHCHDCGGVVSDVVVDHEDRCWCHLLHLLEEPDEDLDEEYRYDEEDEEYEPSLNERLHDGFGWLDDDEVWYAEDDDA